MRKNIAVIAIALSERGNGELDQLPRTRFCCNSNCLKRSDPNDHSTAYHPLHYVC